MLQLQHVELLHHQLQLQHGPWTRHQAKPCQCAEEAMQAAVCCPVLLAAKDLVQPATHLPAQPPLPRQAQPLPASAHLQGGAHQGPQQLLQGVAGTQTLTLHVLPPGCLAHSVHLLPAFAVLVVVVAVAASSLQGPTN